MNEKQCHTCKFWQKRPDADDVMGHCHRYPAVKHWFWGWVFPEMSPNEWCGEYQERGL